MVDGVLIAAEGDAALMATDDAGGDPEAETGAVEVLGGVEGLEEAGLHGGGHAVASIGDGNAYARTALRILGGIVRGVVGADEDAAALAHGIDGVGDEIVEDLADIVFKTQNGRRGGIGGLDLDAGVGETALVEVDYGVGEFCRADVRGRPGRAVCR